MQIFNRTAKARQDLSKIGHSTVASSIEEAVTKSDIIFLCLADNAWIDENMEKITQRECQGQDDCRLLDRLS
jgi:3-hydroxyisobutyrate dehydrogenase-like beta-hydroxyacid dehydrogenase